MLVAHPPTPDLSMFFVEERLVGDDLDSFAFLRLFVRMFGNHEKLPDVVFVHRQWHRQTVLLHQHLPRKRSLVKGEASGG